MASKLERVAGLALGLGRRHLADYGAARSWHDFTQRQLMACLILRAYLKTTYRGLRTTTHRSDDWEATPELHGPVERTTTAYLEAIRKVSVGEKELEKT